MSRHLAREKTSTARAARIELALALAFALVGFAATAHAQKRGAVRSPTERAASRLAVVAVQHEIRGGQSLAALHARMEAKIRAAARDRPAMPGNQPPSP